MPITYYVPEEVQMMEIENRNLRHALETLIKAFNKIAVTNPQPEVVHMVNTPDNRETLEFTNLVNKEVTFAVLIK